MMLHFMLHLLRSFEGKRRTFQAEAFVVEAEAEAAVVVVVMVVALCYVLMLSGNNPVSACADKKLRTLPAESFSTPLQYSSLIRLGGVSR